MLTAVGGVDRRDCGRAGGVGDSDDVAFAAGPHVDVLDHIRLHCRRWSRTGLWNLSRVEGGEPGSDRVVALRIDWPAFRMIHIIARIFQLLRSSGLHLQFHLLSDLLVERGGFLRVRKASEGARPTLTSSLPPVSILKPLKGTDPDIYESFRSHCLQDYPEYEIIFGVSDAGDPAVASVRAIAA